jgi:hypothetical protein
VGYPVPKLREQPLSVPAWVETAWTGTWEKFEVLSRGKTGSPLQAFPACTEKRIKRGGGSLRECFGLPTSSCPPNAALAMAMAAEREAVLW